MLGSIALVVAILYGRTLSFEFVFDDWSYVLENPLLKRLESFAYPLHFTEFATSGEREGFDPDLSLNFILRPVAYFSFFIHHALGGFDVGGFRIVNIAIHAANACLVFLLVARMAKAGPRPRGPVSVSVPLGPFSAALLFAVHPLQIESVTYVSQRFESLATLFFLASCLAYGRYLKDGTVRWKRWSIALLAGGLFSKETVVTAPVMMVLMDWLCFASTLRAACWRARHHLLCVLIVPAMLAAASWAQNGGVLSFSKTVNITNLDLSPITPLDYALTQVCAGVSYLKLLLWPAGQNADADFQRVASLWDARLAVSSSIVIGLLSTGWAGFVKSGKGGTGAVCLLGVLWFFITLAPSSSFIPLPDLFVEHRSYLPSIGVALIVGALVDHVRHRQGVVGWKTWITPAAVACVALVLSVANWRRNEVWRTEVSFWEDAAAKSPGKARPWQSLGTALAARGDKHEGLRCLQKSIGIDPRYLPAWVNIVIIQVELRHYDQAVESSRAALRLYPLSASLHHNLGMALAEGGNVGDAIQSFRRAIDIQPLSADSHACLGHLYRRINDQRRALEHLRKSVVIRPDDDALRDLILLVENESGGISQK